MNTALTALIVDDEPLARDELAFLLAQCEGVEVMAQAGDAVEALETAEQRAPDVAFVDLHMPGPDGIRLAEALHQKYPHTQVVVVSAHDDGALRAFDAQVLDYLLKPVRLERLRDAVERVRNSTNANAEEAPDQRLTRLAVRRQGVYVVVEVADVIYFEVRDELVWAVTPGDRFALDLTMAKLEKQLPREAFFRSHRGALVRVDKIRTLEPAGAGTYELVMDHPDVPRVPLARERAKLLRQRIPVAG